MQSTATRTEAKKKKINKYPGMVVVVLGAPGAGKGTQSELLTARIGAEYIAIGNIIRSLASNGALPDAVITAYDKGDLVPNDFVKDKVLKVLFTIPKDKPVVFDGFPREGNQLPLFNSILKESGREVTAAVFIEVTVSTAVERISKRRICTRCGHSVTTEETVCPICGGELVRREDDKPEVVMKRTEEYLDTIKEVLDHFMRQKKLIRVDGEGKIRDVKSEIFRKLGV